MSSCGNFWSFLHLDCYFYSLVFLLPSIAVQSSIKGWGGYGNDHLPSRIGFRQRYSIIFLLAFSGFIQVALHRYHYCHHHCHVTILCVNIANYF